MKSLMNLGSTQTNVNMKTITTLLKVIFTTAEFLVCGSTTGLTIRTIYSYVDAGLKYC